MKAKAKRQTRTDGRMNHIYEVHARTRLLKRLRERVAALRQEADALERTIKTVKEHL